MDGTEVPCTVVSRPWRQVVTRGQKERSCWSQGLSAAFRVRDRRAMPAATGGGGTRFSDSVRGFPRSRSCTFLLYARSGISNCSLTFGAKGSEPTAFA